MKVMKIVIAIVLIILVLGAGVMLAVIFTTRDTELDEAKLDIANQKVTITSKDGEKLYIKNNNYTKYEDISENIISTFVAVEDKRFFDHKGVDYTRIIGASIKNLMAFKFKEGASTITQQLIKNTHLTNEKSISRKLKEIKLAKELEKKYSKEKILELYMNVIYFGSGLYGVHDACEAFFGKEPKDINLAEACMLVGVVKNPLKNSPIINFDGAKERQNVIFHLLEKQGNIPQSILNNARNYNIVIKNDLSKNTFEANYTKNALAEASKILGIEEKELPYMNIKIETFMDKNAQEYLYNLSKNRSYDEEFYYAYSIIDNSSFGVSAYVSNVPMSYMNMYRQAGSTMKPFSAYLPSMEQNLINSLSIVNDEKTSFDGYSPKNFNDAYHGKVTITDSIINSYNIPAVKMVDEVGVDYVCDFLARYGLNIKDENRSLSLALGANSINPIKLGSMYCSLANYGMYKDCGFVSKIYDKDGKLLYDSKTIKEKRVLDENIAFVMNDILSKTSKYGTAKKLSSFDFDIASKTGTTANSKGENIDGYLMSFTDKYTVGVWHGALDNSTLSSKHMGGGYPTIISKDIYDYLSKTTKFENFEPTDNVVCYNIDKETLYKTGEQLYLNENINRDYIKGYFIKGYEPSPYSNSEVSVPFTLKKHFNSYEIQFDAISGKTYDIYIVDGDDLVLVKSITANGSIVKYIDNRFNLFRDIKYHIIMKN